MKGLDIQKHCPDCGVLIGEFHGDYCDVARCAITGVQRLQCACELNCNTIWWGIWPGIVECHEYDLWCKMTNKGWQKCSPDDPDATEDLNTLIIEGTWSIAQQKMVISTTLE